ncbi:hypothetical protein [Zavarzinia aquatilis]|uniref:Uncharacterized protein n=1 Tax=Zavarzinia aquatilis TaxID=2211142 RepID=A0A317DSK6_9PROT|nr:hypothetical protein [Zavarzinia aquatilis]PWR17658.1 hypothetical protein DKG74_20845 [Zavarzinia aquatilis]
MITPHNMDGRVAAQQGRPVSTNPHATGTRAYYGWLADWHEGQAVQLRAGDPKRCKLNEMARQYRLRFHLAPPSAAGA